MELSRLRGERAAEDACRNLKKSDGVLCEGCAVKYAWIDAQRLIPLPDMCAVLDVSVSSFRAWKRVWQADRTRLTAPQAVALMKNIHARSRPPTARGACTRNSRRGHRIGLRRSSG